MQEAAQAGLRASEPEVSLLSELMHASLREKFLEPSERSWFKLYKTVEADGSGPASGVVTYEEFCRMVEQEPCPYL